MNDNFARSLDFEKDISALRAAQNERLAKSRELAGKALAYPETMTSDEVQEIGWGLLVALKRLRQLGVTVV